MNHLLAFLEAHGRALSAPEKMTALGLALAILLVIFAAYGLKQLHKQADAKIEAIESSLHKNLQEMRRRKALLRVERMRQIRMSLEEGIREMLRASRDRMRQRVENQSEKNGLLRIPVPPGGSPERGDWAQRSRFNSFVAPPHGLSASMVENLPPSGKKFASS